MKTIKNILRLSLLLAVVLVSCKKAADSSDDDGGDDNVVATVPVKVTSALHGRIADSFELNATSDFLVKDVARATATGYIESVKIHVGDHITKGQELFMIKTKEAAAIGNIADSSLHLNGLIIVKANETGVVDSLVHQQGDYVQDGDPLCVISDHSSLVFLLDVPFVMHKFVHQGKPCNLYLPDGDTVRAVIDSRLSTMDISSQTERYVIKPLAKLNLPENLIAQVKINTREKNNAQLLPKKAVLSDETQKNFWVMKMINDSLAVKVPVQKGIESADKVEIVSPVFSDKDNILVSGNYGLGDTAKVKIVGSDK